jgi:hypothetical protein
VRRGVDGSRHLGVYARAGDEVWRSRDKLTTAHRHPAPSRFFTTKGIGCRKLSPDNFR